MEVDRELFIDCSGFMKVTINDNYLFEFTQVNILP